MNRLLIIDGHNYLYKAYYGVPMSAKTRGGIQVNAVYGFFSFLRKLVKELIPDYLVVVFDSEHGIQSKQMQIDEYKKNRAYEDTEIFEQLSLIKKIIANRGICQIEDPNEEADDVIGTIASSASYQVDNSYIASNDYDFMQLVDKNKLVVRLSRGRVDIYNPDKVISTFGIQPCQYLDYLALRGDPSDNIKGVYGIGKITASKLIRQYDTIENLLLNRSNLRPSLQNILESTGEKLKTTKTFLKINTQLNSYSSFSLDKFHFDVNQVDSNINLDLMRIGIV